MEKKPPFSEFMIIGMESTHNLLSEGLIVMTVLVSR